MLCLCIVVSDIVGGRVATWGRSGDSLCGVSEWGFMYVCVFVCVCV